MKNLVWQNRLQFGAMILMAAAMPVSWHLGIWSAVLLALVSAVKLVADAVRGGKPFVNRALGGWQRAALWMVVAYVACYAVSLLYSNDIAKGLDVLGRKAVMLIFPLCFLLTDTSYLKKDHIRILFYALLVAVCGVFLYCCGVAVGKLINGATLAGVTSVTFDARHHAYYSLYAVVACVFVYFEMESQWNRLAGWHKGLLFASVVFIILYVVMINSRAGMLALYAMILACSLHLALTHRRWWVVLMLLLGTTGFTATAETVIPGHQNRIIQTLKSDSDVRVGINKSGLELAKGSSLLGNGAGDYESSLREQYAEDEQTFSDKAFNAHNQYIETLLATGVPGLICMLAWLLLPIVCAVKNKKALWQVMFFTGIVMFNLLFESMLERQMGLLFIGFFHSLLVLVTTLENPHKIT